MLYMKKNNQMLPLTGSTLYADTPIGTLQAFTGNTAPQGYLIFDGREVSRTEYADLWKFANDNNQVGAGKFYGDGNGSTTFTLADLRETSLKGIGLTSRTVGAHIDADGLALGEFVDDRDQKVTGQFSYGAETNVSYGIGPSGALGAFAPSNNNGYYSKYSVSSIANRGPDANIIFDNSRVIRADDTTEVKAVGVNWIVKAKHVALPIDIMDGISEEYATKDYVDAQTTEVSTYTDSNNYITIKKVGKIASFYFSKAGLVSRTVALTIPEGFRPIINFRGALLDNDNDTYAGQWIITPEGRLTPYGANGAALSSTHVYIITGTYIVG